MLSSRHAGKLLVETSELANATRHTFQVHLVEGTGFHAEKKEKCSLGKSEFDAGKLTADE